MRSQSCAPELRFPLCPRSRVAAQTAEFGSFMLDSRPCCWILVGLSWRRQRLAKGRLPTVAKKSAAPCHASLFGLPHCRLHSSPLSTIGSDLEASRISPSGWTIPAHQIDTLLANAAPSRDGCEPKPLWTIYRPNCPFEETRPLRKMTSMFEPSSFCHERDSPE